MAAVVAASMAAAVAVAAAMAAAMVAAMAAVAALATDPCIDHTLMSFLPVADNGVVDQLSSQRLRHRERETE